MSTKEYRDAHKKEIAEYNKAYGITHLEERREYNRAWRKSHPTSIAEHNRKWRHENPEKAHALLATWRKKYPDKAKAHSIISHAICSGRIIRPSVCEWCGMSRGVIEGHHFDYQNPSTVLWLCHACHQKIHLPDEKGEGK
jgi:hypothetical protein